MPDASVPESAATEAMRSFARGEPDPAQALVLRAGDVAVTLHPDVGGRLGQIEVDGHRLLADHSPGENAWGAWGSYVLAPWSNRIAGGRFSFGGNEWTMPELYSDGTAIHGLVHSTPWTTDPPDAADAADGASQHAALSAKISCAPFDLIVRQRFALSDDALTQHLSIQNLGLAPVPVGMGIHPWFRAGNVRVPASLVWPAVDTMPTGPPRPVLAAEDLRVAGVPATMDSCYTGLTDTSADIGPMHLAWTGPISQVVVYTGEPGWACVEPVTNANDAFNMYARGVPGTGVLVLAPGATEQVTYTFSWPGVRST